MNVKELISLLSEMPQEAVVFTAIDDEGNGFRRVYDNWVTLYGYNEFDGEIEIGLLPDQLTEEHREQGYTEEDIKETPCVVIG